MRNGKPVFLLPLIFTAIFPFTATAQNTALYCNASAVPALVRTEGLAERLGDILLQCSGGTPGAASTTNLTIFLAANVTNRISAANVPDIGVTVDTGSGPVPANASIQLAGANAISIDALTFTVPASKAVNIRISNIRASVSQLGLAAQLPVIANLASNGFNFTTPVLTLGFLNRGLLSIGATTSIRCTGSALPATTDLPSLFAAGTRFVSTRVTEGYAQAFTPKDPFSDTGTRILVSYTGFPTGARLFIPDVIAGSSALQPTAGGDLGAPQTGGAYAPSAAGSLLLARVSGADARGAGGTPVYMPASPGSGAVAFTSASEVPLANGAGAAVYEVVDANPYAREGAQFPTFLGLGPQSSANPVTATETVSFAPVSTVAVASASEPVPRYLATPPPSDCGAVGDCGANYFPSLQVDAASLQFAAVSGGAAQIQFVPFRNQGGGVLQFADSIFFYQSGAGWLSVDPPSGAAPATLRAVANPSKLPPGTYRAAILLDGGPIAGSRSIPVTFSVSAAPITPPVAPPTSVPPSAPPIAVSSVTNAASLQAGPLVAGSLGTVKGGNFSGKTLAVAFDGIPATVLYSSATQINFQLPDALIGKTSAQLVITVDGVSSAAQTVALAPVAPAIFSGGILNQDSSVNSRTGPATPGSILQIFATGLISPDGTGVVAVKFPDRDSSIPLYAGAAPGIPGVQQVNVAIPADLAGPPTSEIKVCSGDACSSPIAIYLQ